MNQSSCCQLSAEEAITLFHSSDAVDEKATSLKQRIFAKSVNLCFPIAFDGNVATCRLAGENAASVGYRQILLALNDCTDSVGAEAVKSLLSIASAKKHIRRVNVCIAGAVTTDALTALKTANVDTVIFPAVGFADKKAVVDAAEPHDIGLGMRFTADNTDGQICTLLTAAATLSKPPRMIVCKRDDTVTDTAYDRICQILRIALPDSGMMLSAKEYRLSVSAATALQIDDDTVLDGLVGKLIRQSVLPSFCTACSREGRYGDTFRENCRSGMMHNFCYLNALLSLKEYLSDFASQDSRIVGTDYILRELYTIKNDDVRKLVVRTLKNIRSGDRDFRF